MSTTTNRGVTSGRRDDLTWIRWMLAGNVYGAGAIAVVALAAPGWVATVLGVDGDPLLWRLVGAMWLGFAVASALGLRDPVRYRGVLVAQLIYKAVFVVIALPTALGRPGVAVLVAAFALLVVGYARALQTSADARA